VKLPILPDWTVADRILTDRILTEARTSGAPSLSRSLRQGGDFDLLHRGISTQKKNQSIPAKNARPISAVPVLLFLDEVMHEQQLPLLRPDSLYRSNPLPLLPMRPEAHLD
jgi:hypothetical protein